MFDIKIFDYNTILNDPDLFESLVALTNSGKSLERFGSALLDALNGVYLLSYAVVIFDNDIPLGWGAIVNTENVLSGHVFVSEKSRNNGFGKIIVSTLIDINPNLYFSSTGNISYRLYSHFAPINKIA